MQPKPHSTKFPLQDYTECLRDANEIDGSHYVTVYSKNHNLNFYQSIYRYFFKDFLKRKKTHNDATSLCPDVDEIKAGTALQIALPENMTLEFCKSLDAFFQNKPFSKKLDF